MDGWMDGWMDGLAMDFLLAWLVCLALIKKLQLPRSVARVRLFCWYDGMMSGWAGG
jgi:hypothetical protein